MFNDPVTPGRVHRYAPTRQRSVTATPRAAMPGTPAPKRTKTLRTEIRTQLGRLSEDWQPSALDFCAKITPEGVCVCCTDTEIYAFPALEDMGAEMSPMRVVVPGTDAIFARNTVVFGEPWSLFTVTHRGTAYFYSKIMDSTQSSSVQIDLAEDDWPVAVSFVNVVEVTRGQAFTVFAVLTRMGFLFCVRCECAARGKIDVSLVHDPREKKGLLATYLPFLTPGKQRQQAHRPENDYLVMFQQKDALHPVPQRNASMMYATCSALSKKVLVNHTINLVDFTCTSEVVKLAEAIKKSIAPGSASSEYGITLHDMVVSHGNEAFVLYSIEPGIPNTMWISRISNYLDKNPVVREKTAVPLPEKDIDRKNPKLYLCANGQIAFVAFRSDTVVHVKLSDFDESTQKYNTPENAMGFGMARGEFFVLTPEEVVRGAVTILRAAPERLAPMTPGNTSVARTIAARHVFDHTGDLAERLRSTFDLYYKKSKRDLKTYLEPITEADSEHAGDAVMKVAKSITDQEPAASAIWTSHKREGRETNTLLLRKSIDLKNSRLTEFVQMLKDNGLWTKISLRARCIVQMYRQMIVAAGNLMNVQSELDQRDEHNVLVGAINKLNSTAEIKQMDVFYSHISEMYKVLPWLNESFHTRPDHIGNVCRCFRALLDKFTDETLPLIFDRVRDHLNTLWLNVRKAIPDARSRNQGFEFLCDDFVWVTRMLCRGGAANPSELVDPVITMCNKLDAAQDLAESFNCHDIALKLCHHETYGTPALIENFKKKLAGFHESLYQYWFERPALNYRLLEEEPNEHLLEFIHKHPKLSWVVDANVGDFAAAAKTLMQLAKKEKTVAGRRTLLSKCKLMCCNDDKCADVLEEANLLLMFIDAQAEFTAQETVVSKEELFVGLCQLEDEMLDKGLMCALDLALSDRKVYPDKKDMEMLVWREAFLNDFDVWRSLVQMRTKLQETFVQSQVAGTSFVKLLGFFRAEIAHMHGIENADEHIEKVLEELAELAQRNDLRGLTANDMMVLDLPTLTAHVPSLNSIDVEMDPESELYAMA